MVASSILDITLSAVYWRLHCQQYTGDYIVSSILEITLSAVYWRLHCQQNTGDYIVSSILEITLSAVYWRLHCQSTFIELNGRSNAYNVYSTANGKIKYTNIYGSHFRSVHFHSKRCKKCGGLIFTPKDHKINDNINVDSIIAESINARI
jgi:hypothetical protein